MRQCNGGVATYSNRFQMVWGPVVLDSRAENSREVDVANTCPLYCSVARENKRKRWMQRRGRRHMVTGHRAMCCTETWKVAGGANCALEGEARERPVAGVEVPCC